MSGYMKISVLVTLGFFAALGWHLGTVLGLFGTPPSGQGAMLLRIGLIVIAVLMVSVIGAIVVAKKDGRPAMPDEREEKIELHAERLGVLTIYAGLLCLMWFAFTPLTPMQMANGILLVVLVTETVKLTCALFLLRRRVP